MKGPIRIGCLTLSAKYPRHDEGMQDPAKNDAALREMYESRKAWNEAENDALRKSIVDARNTLDRVKGDGPDLDLSVCASCGRTLRECLELTGCNVGKKIRAFIAEKERLGASVVKVQASSTYGGHTSDRSDADEEERATMPRNRHERRKKDAEDRRRKKHGRRRW